MDGRGRSVMPLAGVAAVALAIVTFALQGNTPGVDDAPRDIVDFYSDNDTQIFISSFVSIISAALLVYFGATLRSALEAGGEQRAFLPLACFAGFVIFAVAIAFDAVILFAMADTANDIPASGIQTLNAVYSDDFLLFILGGALYLTAAGFSIVRTAVLPKWLGVVAIVLGLIAVLGPLGFVTFFGSAIWVAVTSIMLYRQQSSAPQTRTG